MKIRKDINDKMMKLAGFVRDTCDGPHFNKCGEISYWTNPEGFKVITGKKETLSLKALVGRVALQAQYQARKKYQNLVNAAFND